MIPYLYPSTDIVRVHVRVLLKKHAGKKLIVLGDLNVAPKNADVLKATDPDIADISSCKPTERTAFAKNLHNAKLQDAYRHFHPEHSVDDWTWSR
jgi:exonuclease III